MSGVLDYSTDGANWTGLTSAVITPGTTSGSGTYSAQIAGGLPVGVWNVYVRNHAQPTQLGETPAPFAVTPASPAALPTIANHVMAVQPWAALGSFFSDTALSVQAAIGSAVNSIKDSTNTGNNFVSYTLNSAGAPPVFNASSKNGLPALSFTSAAKSLLRFATGAPLPPQIGTSTGWTLAFFLKVTALPASGYSEILGIGDSSPLSDNVRIDILPSGQIEAFFSNGTTVVNITSPSAITVGATTTIVAGYDGTNFKLTVNSQAEQSVAQTVTGSLALSDGWLGCQRTAGSTWAHYTDADLLGMHAWNTAYLTANATALVSYGTSQWGV